MQTKEKEGECGAASVSCRDRNGGDSSLLRG